MGKQWEYSDKMREYVCGKCGLKFMATPPLFAPYRSCRRQGCDGSARPDILAVSGLKPLEAPDDNDGGGE